MTMSPGRVTPAHQPLLDALVHATEEEWLASARARMLQGQVDIAHALFAAAGARFPASREVRLGLAGACWQRQETGTAETLLEEWLADHPADDAAAFLLARLLREQGRLQAVGAVMRRWAQHGPHDTDAIIQAVEILDDYSRPGDAAWICESALAAGNQDPRLHAYAGMLAIQLGDFARVREHYAFALSHQPQAVEWNIPIGLSGLQRYHDESHPDFAFFRDALARADLSDRTRMTTLFALGKAYDDLGDLPRAVDCFRRANAMGLATSQWSRKAWKRWVEARLASAPCPFAPSATCRGTPVFIVGVPRSGTTLLAEQLARHPSVRHRGELGWLQVIAQRLLDAKPDASFVQQQASLYEAQLRQDDVEGADWFIDKQPLNLMHVDVILALWPHARILYCQRNPRDTALSLWTQSFHDHAHDYAYDMGDIAAVIHGCRRLMDHWCRRHPASIHTVDYEQLAAEPARVRQAVSVWLGLPEASWTEVSTSHAISTASAWQARQPVYTRSIGRWRRYLDVLPELSQLPER
ncbi:MAG TPA: sulfotransferase [Dyella sp.]|uniref:tetratricopeptide repeat-containing sulfotransferase family protein n=1 Tax=Dyella sp. TaxID=1869338 RepID=UPI002D792F51|nr:sulfotransferase [Dyella sp.]HET6553875.1 sulfotransferase [Dyella sp.]